MTSPTFNIVQAFHEAVEHHRASRLEEAERLYRSVLEVRPTHADAHHNLGVLAGQVGRAEMALPHFRAAVEANPAAEPYWLSYIEALIRADRPDEAWDLVEQGRAMGLGAARADEFAARLAALAPSPAERAALVDPFANGDWEAAAAAARPWTERLPGHGFAWKVLGAALAQLGQPEGLPALERSTALSPQDAEPPNLLGGMLLEFGRPAEAERAYRESVARAPHYALAYIGLSAALQALGRWAEAEESGRRAVELGPTFPDAYVTHGGALRGLKRPAAAETVYRKGLTRHPEHVGLNCNLALTLIDLGRPTDAEAPARRATTAQPDLAEAANILGNVMNALGRLEEARGCYRDAMRLDPSLMDACNNLGAVLTALGRHGEAETLLREAVVQRPEAATPHSNLSLTLLELGRLTEAEGEARRAIELQPDFAEAYTNLGNALREQCRYAQAEESYREAMRLRPNYAEAYANLLLTMSSAADHDPVDHLETARGYGRMLHAAGAHGSYGWSCEPAPRRLKVGLVSGDIKDHPVGYFLEAVLPRLDPRRIELVAYPTRTEVTALTERIRPLFSAWRPIRGLSDEAAAALIRNDGVHVLLDLAGHTAGGRLPVFAWKPAPVQASWLGYFATTGVAEMDYVVGDPHVCPPGEEGHFTETPWRLPETYMCVSPPAIPVDVGPLPALQGGGVTFGCFNNLTKMNDQVAALWARILSALPEARLLLKTRQLNDAGAQDQVRQRFAAHGVGADRLLLEGSSPRAELLAAYNRVDIALDPFPYPGGVTTLEGLWMGVPFVTRAGNRFLSHLGEGLARNAGLDDWIGQDDDDYVAKAVAHSQDLPRLARLRTGLRRQVLASPLFDAPRFARHVEAALWDMWARDRREGLS